MDPIENSGLANEMVTLCYIPPLLMVSPGFDPRLNTPGKYVVCLQTS